MSYSIRDLADRFGLTLRAIRFYEEKGLLRPVHKAGWTAGQRTYTETDSFRIAEILRGARFGLSLREIKQYLVDGPTGPWLDLPAGIIQRQEEQLAKEIDAREAAIEELRILARKAAGAISGETATTASPEVAKRASAGAR